MTRPTGKAALLFAASLPLALLILAAWPARWYFSFYFPAAVLILLAADMTMLLPWRRLDVETRAPSRLFIGQRGIVSVSLFCRGRPESAVFTVLPEFDGDVDPPAEASGAMLAGRCELDLPIVPRRRGKAAVAAVWLLWRGPLGLAKRIARAPSDEVVDVVPDVRGVHEEAVRFFSGDSIYGMKSQKPHGEGSEFDRLGEYAPGMDNRFIDWKRSARHRKLLCKEFRQERNHQILLGFDTGHLMIEPIAGVPRLDHAIRASLVLGWASLKWGDFVGGCGFDATLRGFLQPGRGMPYFAKLQRFTARLEYRPEETNFTLGLAELGARLKRRGLVVLFTEFVDAVSAELLQESLRLLARRHLVVFVILRDPALRRMTGARPDSFQQAAEAVVANDFLQQRAVVLERFARLGVHCLDVPAETLSSALLNRYLFVKQRGLL